MSRAPREPSKQIETDAPAGQRLIRPISIARTLVSSLILKLPSKGDNNMPWYKFSVSFAESASNKPQEVFMTLFTGNGIPKQFALFGEQQRIGNEAVYYLHVPEHLKILADTYSAIYPLTPCDKPASPPAFFSAGHDEDRALLRS